MRTLTLAVQCGEEMCVELGSLTFAMVCVVGSYDGPAVTWTKNSSAIFVILNETMVRKNHLHRGKSSLMTRIVGNVVIGFYQRT